MRSNPNTGDWTNERDAVRLLGRRVLAAALDGQNPHADLFVMPIQDVPEEDGVLHETTVEGMPMARLIGRIRTALRHGFIAEDEAGSMLGLLYDSGLDTLRTLVEDYWITHGHPHQSNYNVWRGVAGLYDLTLAEDARAAGFSLAEIVAAEVEYFKIRWDSALSDSRIKLDHLPRVSSRGLSPEERLALAVRLDEISAQVALKLAGVPNPTPEVARLALDTVSRLAAQIVYRPGSRQSNQAVGVS